MSEHRQSWYKGDSEQCGTVFIFVLRGFTFRREAWVGLRRWRWFD